MNFSIDGMTVSAIKNLTVDRFGTLLASYNDIWEHWSILKTQKASRLVLITQPDKLSMHRD